MAGSLNRVQLIGNLGRDPEIRALQTGSKVATLSIATTESWKDRQTGERKEATEWHRVVIWNENLVGVVEQYARKGSKLMIEGQLKTRKWQDQAGQDRYSTEVVLSGFDGRVILLGDAGGGGDDRRGSGAGDSGGAGSGYGGGGGRSDIDDEIPF